MAVVNKISGQKRSVEDMLTDEDANAAADSESQSQPTHKIYVENNIIIGIDTSDDHEQISGDIDALTKTLSIDRANELLVSLKQCLSADAPKKLRETVDRISSIQSMHRIPANLMKIMTPHLTTLVLVYNIDSTAEHCDIIDLCREHAALPLAVNYYRGTRGKCWLRFQSHQIALEIVKKLNRHTFEGQQLLVGLVENVPRTKDVKKALAQYNTAKTLAFPVKMNGKRTEIEKTEKTSETSASADKIKILSKGTDQEQAKKSNLRGKSKKTVATVQAKRKRNAWKK
eukprot:CAMPEP_0202694510 /NCGR_PEP_ID=MMETSP1385-20130828/8359_1 /ASSEMBLY_ACC=CAM_ASM_000861 /TAXON_ID=933848 /ORGANISM="Elphidium margaritaceum" /LENGTH=285 /DNA_ID=CAMNT_0049350373 /DNA_START=14 /DNA_END=871 /DNA_ORIENTATION=-